MKSAKRTKAQRSKAAAARRGGTLKKSDGRRERSDKIQAALYKIAETASAGLEMPEFYAAMHRIVGELMYAKSFYILLHDEETDIVTPAYWRDASGDAPAPPVELSAVPKRPAAIVIREGCVLHLSREQTQQGIRRGELNPYGTISEDLVVVPLKTEERTLGAIVVQSYEKGVGYTDENVELLTFVAQHIATALTRARAIEETRQRVAELAIINSVQQGLASKLDIQAIYDLVGDKIRELFNAQSVLIGTYEPQTDLAAFPYLYEKGKRLHVPLRPPSAFTRYMLRSPQTVLINKNFAERGAELGMVLVAGESPKSFLGVPLVVGGEVKGAISIQNIDRENAFSESDVRLLTTLASSLGIALQNARLFDELQTRNRELTEALEQQTATSEILSVIARTPTEIQPVLDAVAEHAARLCDANDVQIYKVEGNLLRQVAHHGPLPALQYGEALPLTIGLITGRAVLEQKTLSIEDTATLSESEYPESVALQRRLGHRTVIATPLVREGIAIGAVVGRRNEVRPFTEKQIALLKTFADQAVIAIENVRLFNELQARNRELIEALEQQTATSEILRVIASTPTEIQPVLDAVAEQAARLCNSYDAAIFRVDGAYYQTVAHWGRVPVAVEDPRRGSPLSRDTVTGHAIIEGRTIHIHDVLTEPEGEYMFSKEYSRRDGQRTMLVTPLLREGTAIGAIAIRRQEVNPFSDKQIALLKTFADQAVIAIENVRLFNELQTRNREITEALEQQTATSDILRVIASSPADIQPVLEIVVQNATRLCAAEKGFIFRLEGDVYRLAVAHNAPAEFIDFIQRNPIHPGRETLVGRTSLERRTVHIHDALADPEYRWTESQRIGHFRTMLGVPMLREGTPIGVIAIWREEVRPFTDKQIELLTTFADQAVIAIENVRLFNETRQRAAELAIINSVGQALASQLELNALIKLVGEKMRETFDAQVVYIALLNRETNQIDFPYYDDQGRPRTGPPLVFGQGLTSKIIQSRQPLLINNEQQIIATGIQRIPPSKSYLGVPIMIGEEAIGVISVQNVEREGAFSESDMRLLTTITSNVGIALQNARLFGETQSQKQFFEAVVLNSPVAIVIADLGSKVVSWNPAAEKLFGYAQAETIGRDLNDLIALSDEIRAEAEACSLRAAHGELFHSITRRNRKDGSLVDVELSVVPVHVGGIRVGAIAIYHDLTELKRAEEELRQQKEYFEAVVSNSPVAIVLTALDQRVVSWNPAAEKLFGYTHAEAVGRDLDDLVANREEIRQEAIKFRPEHYRGETFHAITRRTRKDGTLVDVELLGEFVIVDGHPVGGIAIYHDITELVRARREAEAANQAKSAFLATMSHEIRTPMNAVIGMSNLLLDTNLSDEQREYAGIIRNSGDALLTVINDILDFSKIEAGKMELENAPFDLRDCVESALDLLTPHAAEKGLDLAYLIEEGTPAAIVGDVTRLRQILINLLNNAIKFTEKGEVAVAVKTEDGRPKAEAAPSSIPSLRSGQAPRPPSSAIHFSVRDTGIGIPSEQMSRLFESFSQADTSTARKYGGTGLGLAISKRLCELMGGTMWVESAGVPGKGSTFHFTIAAQAAADFVTRDYLRGEQPPLSGKRLLIVDDNETNRQILMQQTRAWGMLVHDTTSPAEALEWIRRGDLFDIAILDMHMPRLGSRGLRPEMDGVTLATEIRKHRDAKTLPLVIFSSLGSPIPRSLAGKRETPKGMELFAANLIKPIKPSQLFDALIGILGEQTAHPQKPEKPSLDPEMSKHLPLRILLAEDNVVNQKLAIRLLGQMGYRADVAANGQEAIDALERQRYDVVLMDVQMPEMDGLEASRRISQRWARESRPRIIAMTANATQGDREMCLQAGMDDYISKPIHVHELVNALSRSKAESRSQ